MAYTHNGVLFSLKTERNQAICDNMDELGEHFAKWSKPDMEGQILHDITFIWNIK